MGLLLAAPRVEKTLQRQTDYGKGAAGQAGHTLALNLGKEKLHMRAHTYH